MDILSLSAIELQGAIASGKASSVDAVEQAFLRINRLSRLNATLALDYDGAIRAAKRADERRGDGLLLNGVPVLIKDNISTKGLKTTCGSRLLSDYEPVFDATVVERLKDAGAVIIGKANMDEFGMGSRGESSAFGAVKNPFDEKLSAGGSSSGSACAVAANICPISIGSDTGGSITMPSSHCGVVGLKPTYAAVPRYGLIAYASSLDRIGPICRSVRDTARVMSVIAGADGRDNTCIIEKSDYEEYAVGVKGLTVGVPDLSDAAVDSAVIDAVFSAAKMLEKRGARLKAVSLPYSKEALSAYYAISCAEAASNLARYDGVKFGKRAEGGSYAEICERSRTYGFGEEVKRRIVYGNLVLSGEGYDRYYLKANAVRASVTAAFKSIFDGCDAVLSPASTGVAPRLGEKNEDTTSAYNEDLFNVPVSLCGLPSLCMPVAKKGVLPLGVQIVADKHCEKTLFAVGEALEEETAK